MSQQLPVSALHSSFRHVLSVPFIVCLKPKKEGKMETLNINTVIIDQQVLDALKDYQADGAEIDCQTLEKIIDYLFRVSEMIGYADDMDGGGMLKLIYSLRQMKENLVKLLPEDK